MNRSTRALLGLGTATAAIGGAVVGLFRAQSGRLRAQLDADRAAPTPPLLTVVGDGPEPRDVIPEDDGLPAVAVLGDTWLCGDDGTRPGLLIARGLPAILESPVRLFDQSTASASAEDVARQVARLLSAGDMRSAASAPRYAVMSMGMTDIVHPVLGSLTIPVLTTALNRLQHEGGYRAIVLTCPDLGGLPTVRRPLRSALRRSSRVLSGSQWVTAVSSGALPVSIHQSLAGTTQIGLLARAGHRPSRLGYQQIAAAVLARIAYDRALTVTAEEVDEAVEVVEAVDPAQVATPTSARPREDGL